MDLELLGSIYTKISVDWARIQDYQVDTQIEAGDDPRINEGIPHIKCKSTLKLTAYHRLSLSDLGEDPHSKDPVMDNPSKSWRQLVIGVGCQYPYNMI